MRCFISSTEAEKERGEAISPSSVIVLFRPLLDWMMPIHIAGGRGNQRPPIKMPVSSRNTLTDTHRNNV